MKIFVHNYRNAEDYMKDLVLNHLLYNDYEIYTNSYSAFAFDDYPARHKLYGMGHTVYANVPSYFKNRLKFIPPATHKDYDFDYILFSEVRGLERVVDTPWCKEIFEKYPKEKIIVLDGLDTTKIWHDLAEKATYYKRELVQETENVQPIAFSFPSFGKIPRIIDKENFLAPCDPRFAPNSYRFWEEKFYYLQYMRAMFGVTMKKGGWDCMRHYEILACNSVPYFPDIEEKPKYTMIEWPMDLQIRANKLYEKMAIGRHKLDLDEWNKINDEFQEWFYWHGTSFIYNKLFC